jgi:hypothetical protein
MGASWAAKESVSPDVAWRMWIFLSAPAAVTSVPSYVFVSFVRSQKMIDKIVLAYWQLSVYIRVVSRRELLDV